MAPTNGQPELNVVVVGAGISGLTAAHKLRRYMSELDLRVRIQVLEASGRTGGLIETIKHGDAILERGPESFVTNKPAALQLAQEIGLTDNILQNSRAGSRTFVGFRNSLHALPEGFVLFAPSRLVPLAVSELFSWPGKLRMALELLIPPSSEECHDESLAEFVTRRLGREALDRLAEPLVGGIYCGDPHILSASAVVPKLYQLERECGSLIRGLWQSGLTPPARDPANTLNGGKPTFITFDDGLQTLTNTLVAQLPGGSLAVNSPVSRVVPGLLKRWRIICANGRAIEADAVILATPAKTTAQLLKELDRTTSEQLSAITYGSTGIFSLIFSEDDIRLPAGSGFVVPKIEGKLLKACSFSSLKFVRPGLENKVLVRMYVDADGLGLDQDILEHRLIDDARTFFHISGKPLFSLLTKHTDALPQYTVGHSERMSVLKNRIDQIAGLAIAGNAYSGFGIPDCVQSGEDAAKRTFVSLLA